MQDNIIVLKFEDSKLPVFKEEKREGYIKFGENDDYPDYLLKMADKSPKHNAIICGKVNYIYGNGLQSLSSNEQVKAWIDKCNSGDESLNEVTAKTIYDIEVYGGFYWNVITDMLGRIQSIYHIDFNKIRSNKDRDVFFYKEEWNTPAGRKQKPRQYPRFAKNKVGSFIFAYREYRPGQGTYALPNYISSMNYIESDYQVSKHTLGNSKTGFSASKFINFYNGEPEDEGKKRQIETRFNAKFGGSEGKKMVIGFNSDPAKKPTIDDLGASDLTKEDFTAVDNLIASNIYAGHQITSPMLFGIMEPGKLGAGNELKFAYDIFKNTYVNFKQKKVEAILNYFSEIQGMVGDLKLQDVDPIGIPFSDQTLVQVAPLAWIWEKLGIDPAKYPNSAPAIPPKVAPTPVNGGDPADNINVEQEKDSVNDNIKNLSAKQHQQLMRIIRQFSKGQLNKAQAMALLKAGLGLTDQEITALLGIEEDQQFDKVYTEEEVADMFAEIGEMRETFEIIKTKNASFGDEEFTANEIFATVAEATTLEEQIMQLIEKDKRITNEVIASTLKIDVSAVADAIKRLQDKGLLTVTPTTDQGDKAVIREVTKPVSKVAKQPLPDISVKYSYEVGPGNGAPIIPGTRPFCKKLVELNRLYTRSEIQQISMRVGYSVWDRRGGFWTRGKNDVSAACRHVWKSHVVIKKKA